MNKCFGWLLGLLLLGFMVFSPDDGEAGRVLNDALVTRPFRHHIWHEVLVQNVNSAGEVDFARLRAYPRRLNQYLEQLEAASPENAPELFLTWEDQAAYWVNAHNAIALRLILDQYPVASIAEVPNFESNTRYKLGGKPYPLSQIRPKAVAFKRAPSLLFALTDYSMGSPPVFPQAYEGQELKKMLRLAQKNALGNARLVRFERQDAFCTTVYLSRFFQSYEATLLAPAAGEEEDRDLLDESQPEPAGPRGWNEIVRPFAPPDVYHSLEKSCSRIQFSPGDPTLRQIILL